MMQKKSDQWTVAALETLYQKPFMDLILQAQNTHRLHFIANRIQICALYNIKVGGCPEDCHWCGQSVYHGVKSEPLASLDWVEKRIQEAKKSGVTRICLAASLRGPSASQLVKIMAMVKAIKAQGLEACITVGKLSPEQAKSLKASGLDYYNHNVETSERYFSKVSTTRTHADRLATLEYVRNAGIKVCSGGILGMGEQHEDRLELLCLLANQPTQPQSVPINLLVPIPGTPLGHTPPLNEIEYVRYIALARLIMPKSYIRLSGGRRAMSPSMQTLCFLAGANSIHHGPRLLVTQNAPEAADQALFTALGCTLEQGAEQTTFCASKAEEGQLCS